MKDSHSQPLFFFTTETYTYTIRAKIIFVLKPVLFAVIMIDEMKTLIILEHDMDKGNIVLQRRPHL